MTDEHAWAETDDPFIDRLRQLRGMTQTTPKLSDLARSRVTSTIEMVLDVYTAAMNTSGGAKLREGFAAPFEDLLGRLPQLLHQGEEEALLAWSRSILKATRSRLDAFLEMPSYYGVPQITEDEIASLNSHARRLLAEDERLAVLEDDVRYRSYAANLVERAEETASKLQEAAGIAGDAKLAEHFERYARREWWSANLFRILTIAAIVGALLLAVLLPKPHGDDWITFSYRLAQLVGVAALATYFGRQAAQHRRVFNWARSLQVQLQSFPAFIEPVGDEETRSGIYDAFARRVLGPPPEKGGSGDEAYPHQQVIELLTAVAKKA